MMDRTDCLQSEILRSRGTYCAECNKYETIMELAKEERYFKWQVHLVFLIECEGCETNAKCLKEAANMFKDEKEKTNEYTRSK